VAERSAEHWYPTAAYLYVLHLDAPALAWEYLRRNPDYRRDWLRRQRRPDAAQRWGLRLLENPALDARDAHPAWFPDHDRMLQLVPDSDPPPDAVTFAFWHLPGHKQLLHDGKRLMLMANWPGNALRFALAPDLTDGVAFAYAVRAGTAATSLRQLANTITTTAQATPAVVTHSRPTAAALLELHTLQALDATLAGASLREVAEGLFGVDAVQDWYADGGLRSKTRRLVQRGDTLMRGGYRLAQISSLEKGRFEFTAKRP